MKLKKWIVLGIIVVVAGVFFISKCRRKDISYKEITPERGPISLIISANGVVKPRNRLEIKPPLSGRVEKVIVTEGEKVKKGEILAWLSSTERAALLDAARAKGDKELKKWEDVYKPTPIIAPLSGFIIKRSVEPGQTVSSQDPILVMADNLIIKAQIDETDLGKLKLKQKVEIILDAYPEKEFRGKVEHIAYESNVVNNVTVYRVDILPDKVPEIFRSGMSANVDIIINRKRNAILIPVSAVRERKRGKFVLLKTGKGDPELTKVSTGIEDGKNVEIISGIKEDDLIVISSEKEKPRSRRRRGGLPGMGRR